MAAESIGNLIPTKIPGYADQADIQAALRVYHYGSYDYNTANTSPASLVDPSMAKTIYDIQQDVSGLETSSIQASVFAAKGDLLSASANDTPLIISVGSNNQILVANNATATGLQWTSTLTSPTITTPTINQPTLYLRTGSASTSASATGDITLSTASGLPTYNNGNGEVRVLVNEGSAQTLTNKTLTQPFLRLRNATSLSGTSSGEIIYNNNTSELQFYTGSATSTVVDLTSSQTLTNKTLQNSLINGTSDNIALTVTGGPTGALIPDIQRWKNSAGSVVAYVDSTGNMFSNNIAVATTSATQTISNKNILVSTNAITSTTYTFVIGDAGKLVTSAITSSTSTFSIPLNSSVAFPVGTIINVFQAGSGQVTIQAATSGVSISSNAASTAIPKLRVAYSAASLIKVDTNSWYVVGDIV